MTSIHDDAQALTLVDADAIRDALDVDPVTDLFLDARLRPALAGRQLRDDVVGQREASGRHSLCWLGANVVPTANTSDEAADAYARQVKARNVWFSSLWGPRAPVARMWSRLAGTTRRPRSVRELQHFMVLEAEPDLASGREVVRVDMSHVDAYYAAAVAFNVEELGQSPELYGGGAYYRARVRDLIDQRHAFAIFDGDRLVAKADIAFPTAHASMIQGVWVTPDARGHGLGREVVGAASVVARTEIAPVVTLYVNAFNVPAYRCYRRLGYVESAEFMTLLW